MAGNPAPSKFSMDSFPFFPIFIASVSAVSAEVYQISKLRESGKLQLGAPEYTTILLGLMLAVFMTSSPASLSALFTGLSAPIIIRYFLLDIIKSSSSSDKEIGEIMQGNEKDPRVGKRSELKNTSEYAVSDINIKTRSVDEIDILYQALETLIEVSWILPTRDTLFFKKVRSQIRDLINLHKNMAYEYRELLKNKEMPQESSSFKAKERKATRSKDASAHGISLVTSIALGFIFLSVFSGLDLDTPTVRPPTSPSLGVIETSGLLQEVVWLISLLGGIYLFIKLRQKVQKSKRLQTYLRGF